MLLFQKRFHAGLVDGSVTLTIRAWDRPHVRVGGRYRVHPIGVVEVDAVERVRVRELSEDDARAAGFESLEGLLSYVKPVVKGRFSPATEVFRIRLHHGGDGDRVELALEDQLTAEDVSAIAQKLDALDARGPTEGRRRPWTREVLALIAEHPQVAASQLAAMLGRETQPFKLDVRKLKKLGLTQSFEVGYEISPRGVAFLQQRPSARAAGARRRARSAPLKKSTARRRPVKSGEPERRR